MDHTSSPEYRLHRSRFLPKKVIYVEISVRDVACSLQFLMLCLLAPYQSVFPYSSLLQSSRFRLDFLVCIRKGVCVCVYFLFVYIPMYVYINVGVYVREYKFHGNFFFSFSSIHNA